MAIPTLPTLPAPPSRQDPTNFAARADAFLLALVAWAAVLQQVSAAIDQAASNAAASAASALAAPGTAATSTTQLTVGTGTQTLTIQTGKAYSVGQGVQIAYTSDPTIQMRGRITAYNSGTGALTVNVISRTGSGTYSAWTVSIGAVPDVASVAGIRAGTSEELVTVKGMYDALAPVTIADSASPSFDLTAGDNFEWTLAGNRTLPNPSAVVLQKKFRIRVKQDATGNRLLTFGSAYKFERGVVPILSTAAGAEDIFYGDVLAADRIVLYQSQGIA